MYQKGAACIYSRILVLVYKESTVSAPPVAFNMLPCSLY